MCSGLNDQSHSCQVQHHHVFIVTCSHPATNPTKSTQSVEQLHLPPPAAQLMNCYYYQPPLHQLSYIHLLCHHSPSHSHTTHHFHDFPYFQCFHSLTSRPAPELPPNSPPPQCPPKSDTAPCVASSEVPSPPTPPARADRRGGSWQHRWSCRT